MAPQARFTSISLCEKTIPAKFKKIFRRKGRPAELNTALKSQGESPGLGVPDGRITL